MNDMPGREIKQHGLCMRNRAIADQTSAAPVQLESPTPAREGQYFSVDETPMRTFHIWLAKPVRAAAAAGGWRLGDAGSKEK